jgi:hypothetical protein
MVGGESTRGSMRPRLLAARNAQWAPAGAHRVEQERAGRRRARARRASRDHFIQPRSR